MVDAIKVFHPDCHQSTSMTEPKMYWNTNSQSWQSEPFVVGSTEPPAIGDREPHISDCEPEEDRRLQVSHPPAADVAGETRRQMSVPELADHWKGIAGRCPIPAVADTLTGCADAMLRSALAQPTAGEAQRLRAVIERDRTEVARVFHAIRKALHAHSWMLEGRGSYEWNDDKFYEEFGRAWKAVYKAADPLEKIASNLTDSPDTEAERVAALARPTSPEMWMVIRKRETEPVEVSQFYAKAEAIAFYDQARLQWTETYLCRVEHGPGTLAQPTSEGDETALATPAPIGADGVEK